MNGKQSQLREGGVWGVSFMCLCLFTYMKHICLYGTSDIYVYKCVHVWYIDHLYVSIL